MNNNWSAASGEIFVQASGIVEVKYKAENPDFFVVVDLFEEQMRGIPDTSRSRLLRMFGIKACFKCLVCKCHLISVKHEHIAEEHMKKALIKLQ